MVFIIVWASFFSPCQMKIFSNPHFFFTSSFLLLFFLLWCRFTVLFVVDVNAEHQWWCLFNYLDDFCRYIRVYHINILVSFVLKCYSKHLNKYFVEPHICFIFSCCPQVQQIRHNAIKLSIVFMYFHHSHGLYHTMSATFTYALLIWKV